MRATLSYLAVVAAIATAFYLYVEMAIGGGSLQALRSWVYFYLSLVVLAGPLAALGVALIRALRWPRPLADAAVGAIDAGAIAGLGAFILNGVMLTPDVIEPSAIRLALVVGVLAGTGALAGACYWLLAGRPRAPYG